MFTGLLGTYLECIKTRFKGTIIFRPTKQLNKIQPIGGAYS